MSHWIENPCAQISGTALDAAEARQTQLTKPVGSLGRLETTAIQFAGWQNREKPNLDKVGVRVFAADHGITAQGVSAFPAEVTLQMIVNFLAGGAAISVLSEAMNADFAVVNMGTCSALAEAPHLHQYQLMPGTQDFSQQVAIPIAIVNEALDAGCKEVEALDCELFIGGEMGIGNTTSAAAIVTAITGRKPADVVGRGTGIDDATLARKRAIVVASLNKHSALLLEPLSLMSAVGGLEIAGLCGAYLRCAQRGIPILLDGFIATAAAMLAQMINPRVTEWMLASHQSAEPGHVIALDHLDLQPLLKLDMRLGEGSGAAVAVPLIQSALLLHGKMATFAEAGVADGSD